MDLSPSPWDLLSSYKKIATEKQKVVVDLSIGSPVDPVPDNIRKALEFSSFSSGYPMAKGSVELDYALVAALQRRFKASNKLSSENVVPTIGSKEAIALLPFILNINKPKFLIPELAYPTYKVAADLVNAEVIYQDFTRGLPDNYNLAFLNFPANPTGQVLDKDLMVKILAHARERNAILVSDECYLGLDWTGRALSFLNPEINNGNFQNLLVTNSLSKVSNLAGYRTGFLAGDSKLIAKITLFRKQVGLLVPTVIQVAMQTALADDEHLKIQKDRYLQRRKKIQKALSLAGFEIYDSDAGLFLWVKADNYTTDWDLVDLFARQGIIVAPGSFYGKKGANHIRISTTATDTEIDLASNRIAKIRLN